MASGSLTFTVCVHGTRTRVALPTQHSLIEEVLLGFGPHSLKALLLATTKHTRLIGRTLHSRTGRGGDDSR